MLDLKNFKLDLRHSNRTSEILDAYRIKLTGSLECRNENRIYDFIYRERPYFLSEILMIMYQIGYEDGLKEGAKQAKPLVDQIASQAEQDYTSAGLKVSADSKVSLRLVVDNTKNRPDPDPPANVVASILAA